ncbi:MAG: ABC transporter substrate-binding protein [Gaiellaceae bacterium]
MPTRLAIAIAVVIALIAVTFGTLGAAARPDAQAAAQQKRGGHLRIARQEDSQSFDKTNVFQNESIWLTQQINESLYTVAPDGKTLKPWLATSYKVSKNGKKYTFKLRKGVRFSNGKAMTAADVKFSIDDARAQDKGWGYLDVAIKDIKAPNPSTVVFNLKYPWAPFLADISAFNNGIIPKNFAGQKREEFYKHPIGTGPFMWDKRVVGESVSFKRNPLYWQKGKPYLDRVTWTYVSNQNTRELQLRGGQIEVDQFPPFSSIKKLQSTSGVKMFLFPSTRTDYLVKNEAYAPLKDVHVRRAISYSLDRAAITKALLFGYGKPANSFMPPQVPYYDPKTPGIQYNPAKAKAELARSKFKNGFNVELLVGAGNADDSRLGQVLQQALEALNINVKFRQIDQSTLFSLMGEGKYQLVFNYWTMDIADPDELVTFAVDPKGGANSFFTGYRNPTVIKLTHQGQRQINPAKRRAIYSRIQRLAAEDAFMGFLYYSPFRYATASKVNGFFVTPLGNYHLEDVWLS